MREIGRAWINFESTLMYLEQWHWNKAWHRVDIPTGTSTGFTTFNDNNQGFYASTGFNSMREAFEFSMSNRNYGEIKTVRYIRFDDDGIKLELNISVEQELPAVTGPFIDLPAVYKVKCNEAEYRTLSKDVFSVIEKIIEDRSR